MQQWIAQLPRKQSLALLIGSQCLALAIGLWMACQLLIPGSNASGVKLSPYISTPILFFWIASLQMFPLILFALSNGKKQTEIEHDFRYQQSQLNGELVRTRDAVIFGLAKLAESRDTDTGYHLERISAYSTRLAQALRRDPRFRNEISAQFIRDIGVCSALHDIGKVGVEDAILLKPGPLTPDRCRVPRTDRTAISPSELSGNRARDRAAASRKMGWQRLSAGTFGKLDSPLGPHRCYC
jgi:hypothetical protein